jgi:hypothetical protein
MVKKKILVLLTAILTTFIFEGCSNGENITDYSEEEHWLALPDSTDKEVDIFLCFLNGMGKV